MSAVTKWVSTLLPPTSATTLGRLVADVSDPDDNFRDTSRSQDLPDGPEPASMEIEAENIQYDDIKDKQQGFSIALTAIFSSTLKIQKKEVSKIIADRITTRKLLNPSIYFQHVCQNNTVREWLEQRWRRGKRAYMVTGIMTLLNAHITLSREVAREVGQGIAAPGTMILIAGTQGAVPTLGGIESVLDSNLMVSRDATKHVTGTVALPGETIMAIQYRQVDFAWFRRPSPTNMALSTRSRWKTYLGNRGEDSGSLSDEEASLEEDEDIDAVTLEAVIGGNINHEDFQEYNSYEIYPLGHAKEIWVVS